jgi:hypothetical protein
MLWAAEQWQKKGYVGVVRRERETRIKGGNVP